MSSHPMLLHMPEFSNSSPRIQAPKLLKVLLPGYSFPENQTSRHPLQQKDNNAVTVKDNYKVPNLIDLRKVGSVITAKHSKNENAPKLLKLPFLHTKGETKPSLPTKNQLFSRELPKAIPSKEVKRKVEQVGKNKEHSKSITSKVVNQEISLASNVNANPERNIEVYSEKSQLKLLESPKREKLKEIKVQQPLVRKIFDIRPSNNQVTEEKKFITVKAGEKSHSNKRAKRQSKQEKPQLQTHRYESDVSHSSYSYISQRRKKTVSDREEEIYDVIYDLFRRQKRRQKKKRLRRLNLFDIIDNIPLTSESDTSPVDINVRKQIRENKQKNTIDEQATHLSVLKNDYEPLKNDYNPYTQQIYSSIPNPPSQIKKSLKFENLTSNQQDSSHSVKENYDTDLVQYQPKISNYLRPENFAENDPLSWLNIIRNARTDTKDTQTDSHQAITPISVEVQTEMKEMTEIPKTQTFFTDEHKQFELKQTSELCDRIRKDVIEKLEPKVSVDDKKSQTIASATTQTENNEDLIVGKQNNQQDGIHVNLPPNLYSKINISHGQDIGSNVNEFMHVVDIHMSNEDYLLSKDSTENNKNLSDASAAAIENVEHLIEIDRNFENNSLSVFQTVINGKEEKATEKDIFHGKTFKLSDSSNKKFRVGADITQNFKHQEKMIKEKNMSSSRSRSLLGGHMDDFSAGLDAIEEIQQSIEHELKHSRFLFETITTLQDGLTSTQTEVITGNKQSEIFVTNTNSDKYSVYKSRGNNSISAKSHVTNEKYDIMQNELHELSEHSLEEEAHIEEGASKETSPRSQKSGLPEPFLKTGEVMELQEGGREILNDMTNFSTGNRNLSVLEKSKEERNLESLLGKVSPIFERRISEENEDSEYDHAGRDYDDEKKQQDELFKEEVRRRICKPIADPAVLRKEEKHRKLVKWMKQKRSERHEEYMKNLDDKRSREFRPFVSSRKFTTKEIDENTSLIEESKRFLLQENNEERMKMAEKIADHVISESRQSKLQTFMKNSMQSEKPRKFSVDNPKQTSIPVRETRTSRIRKRALINQMVSMKNISKRNAEKKPSKINTNRRLVSNSDSPSRKYSRKKKNDETSLFISSRLEESLNVSRYVGADEFVTQETFENYLTKSQVMLKESFKKYTGNSGQNVNKMVMAGQTRVLRNDGEKDHRVFQCSSSNLTSNLSMLNKKHEAYQQLKHEGNSDFRTSETLQLLDEVDRLLENGEGTDSEADYKHGNNGIVGTSVDWNEVDRILNATD